MHDNALPVFDMDEQRRNNPEKKVDEYLDAVKADLQKKKHYIQPASKEETDFYKDYKAYPIAYSASIEKPRYKV